MENFIQVVSVEDYHDFDLIIESFKGLKLKIYEHGLGDDRRYWGVVFVGKKRKKADILKMLTDAGYLPFDSN